MPFETHGPLLELRAMRHPCLALGASAVIPNDTLLGLDHPASACERATCLVVTGPNMGGKSTVLRQTCLAALMAQVTGPLNPQ